jgi:hypothetical protein
MAHIPRSAGGGPQPGGPWTRIGGQPLSPAGVQPIWILAPANIRQFSRTSSAISRWRPPGRSEGLPPHRAESAEGGRRPELAGTGPDRANQPTRGLDVGSIEFVHQTLLQARSRGAAVLLVSVELDEVLSLKRSHRVCCSAGRSAGDGRRPGHGGGARYHSWQADRCTIRAPPRARNVAL